MTDYVPLRHLPVLSSLYLPLTFRLRIFFSFFLMARLAFLSEILVKDEEALDRADLEEVASETPDMDEASE